MDIQWLHFIAHELSWRWSPLGRVGHQGVWSQPSAVLPVSCLQFSPRIVSSPISWKQVAPASVPLASVSLLSLCCTIFITQWMFLFEDLTAFHEKLFSPPNLSCVWGIPRVVVIILVILQMGSHELSDLPKYTKIENGWVVNFVHFFFSHTMLPNQENQWNGPHFGLHCFRASPMTS